MSSGSEGDGGVGKAAVIETRVELAVAHLLERLAGDFVVQFDFEQRKRLDGLREQVTDPDEARIGDGADADPAGDLALEGAGVAAQHLRGGDDLLRFRQQAAAGGGQFHAARQPFEQRDAEFVLERLDLGAQRRLTDVKPVGRAGQVSRLGDRREAPELVELHRTPYLSLKR